MNNNRRYNNNNNNSGRGGNRNNNSGGGNRNNNYGGGEYQGNFQSGNFQAARNLPINNNSNNGGGNNIPNNNWSKPERISSIGSVTEMVGQNGIINDEVFFDLSSCIGPWPQICDQVAFEAISTPFARFKWTATKTQVISSMQINWNQSNQNGQMGGSLTSSNNLGSMSGMNGGGGFNNNNGGNNNNMNNGGFASGLSGFSTSLSALRPPNTVTYRPQNDMGNINNRPYVQNNNRGGGVGGGRGGNQRNEPRRNDRQASGGRNNVGGPRGGVAVGNNVRAIEGRVNGRVKGGRGMGNRVQNARANGNRTNVVRTNVVRTNVATANGVRTNGIRKKKDHRLNTRRIRDAARKAALAAAIAAGATPPAPKKPTRPPGEAARDKARARRRAKNIAAGHRIHQRDQTHEPIGANLNKAILKKAALAKLRQAKGARFGGNQKRNIAKLVQKGVNPHKAKEILAKKLTRSKMTNAI